MAYMECLGSTACDKTEAAKLKISNRSLAPPAPVRADDLHDQSEKFDTVAKARCLTSGKGVSKPGSLDHLDSVDMTYIYMYMFDIYTLWIHTNLLRR